MSLFNTAGERWRSNGGVVLFPRPDVFRGTWTQFCDRCSWRCSYETVHVADGPTRLRGGNDEVDEPFWLLFSSFRDEWVVIGCQGWHNETDLRLYRRVGHRVVESINLVQDLIQCYCCLINASVKRNASFNTISNVLENTRRTSALMVLINFGCRICTDDLFSE